MPLPVPGNPISLGAIQVEYGGVPPDAISEYYAGGPYVKAGEFGTNGPIPAAGTLPMSKFYGSPHKVVGSWLVAFQGKSTSSGMGRFTVVNKPTDGSLTPAVNYKADPAGNLLPVLFSVSHVSYSTGQKTYTCSGGAKPVRGRDGAYYCLPKSSYSEMALPVGFWHDMGTPRGVTVRDPPKAHATTPGGGDHFYRVILRLLAPVGAAGLNGLSGTLSAPGKPDILLPATMPDRVWSTRPPVHPPFPTGTSWQFANFYWDNPTNIDKWGKNYRTMYTWPDSTLHLITD